MSKIGKSIKAESRLWLPGAGAWVRGKWEVTAEWYGGSFWSDENFLKVIVVTVAQLCEYIKTSELYTLMGEFYGI